MRSAFRGSVTGSVSVCSGGLSVCDSVCGSRGSVSEVRVCAPRSRSLPLPVPGPRTLCSLQALMRRESEFRTHHKQLQVKLTLVLNNNLNLMDLLVAMMAFAVMVGKWVKMLHVLEQGLY